MTRLSPVHEAALARAIRNLEEASFAARLADYAGQPVNKVLQALPRRVTARVSDAVEIAVRKGLDASLRGMDLAERRPPRTRLSTAIAGVSGGVGGFFGVAALPIELPVTTMLMLRAIAAIARHQGEDLTRLEPRLACLQVFALGSRASDQRADVG